MYFPRNPQVYRYADCGMLSAMNTGLKISSDRSVLDSLSTETQRFPKLDDPEWQKLCYLQGVRRSAYWLDGKIPKQAVEKHFFTVRFTVNFIRRER